MAPQVLSQWTQKVGKLEKSCPRGLIALKNALHAESSRIRPDRHVVPFPFETKSALIGLFSPRAFRRFREAPKTTLHILRTLAVLSAFIAAVSANAQTSW